MGLYMSAKTVELSKDVYQAMRDAIEFSTNNAELSNLASDGAFYKMLDFFKELGYENPSIERMNFMQKRIFELSRQNEEFRKTLEMPAEELNLYKMRANGRNSHKKTLVILRILDNERKENICIVFLTQILMSLNCLTKNLSQQRGEIEMRILQF